MKCFLGSCRDSAPFSQDINFRVYKLEFQNRSMSSHSVLKAIGLWSVYTKSKKIQKIGYESDTLRGQCSPDVCLYNTTMT